MPRTRTLDVFLLFLAVVATFGCMGGGSSKNSGDSGGGTPSSTPGSEKIHHIVFTLQENRSFDNYFGRLGQYRRDHGFTDKIAELPLNVVLKDKLGNPISPYHFRTACHENVSPSWNQSHLYWDKGKMDKFTHTYTQSPIDPGGDRAMGYYDWRDLPYYYALATQYATSDSWFSSVLTETVPNRMYLLGGTSWGAILFDGPFPSQYTLIWDRLNKAGISWKYYTTNGNNLLLQFPGGQARYGSHFADISQYFNDLKSDSTFPQVAFLERAVGLDEHPHNDIQLGAAHIKTFVDALMQSPAWSSSVFILAYDEGGGMYDHVPPVAMPAPDSIPPMLTPTDFPGDFTLTGFRVPFLIVSPWVKPHLVSHINRDHTSILKFIETRFNLKPLTARDSAADDMMEFFDFSSPPNTALPQLPDQPTNEPCDFNLELPE